jgi:hypothetical protein
MHRDLEPRFLTGRFSAWPGQNPGREVFSNGEEQMSLGRIAVAATTFVCMTLLSVGWSGQHGVSLGIASAQAQASEPQASKQQASKPQASKHMAASSHRQGRRIVRGTPNPVAAGADLAAGAADTAGAAAAGAIGTAGAIAAAPFGGSYAQAPGSDSGYYAPSAWGDFDCRPGYAGCRPYSSKDWSKP